MKQDKQSYCVAITRREEDGTQPIIPYMLYLTKTDMSLSENNDAFALVSAKLKYQILFQGISDATKIGLYHALAIENSESEKFLNSAWHFFLQWRLSRSFKWLKETSFYERSKEIFTKTQKGKKETVVSWISGSKSRSFITQEVGRKIFP